MAMNSHIYVDVYIYIYANVYVCIYLYIYLFLHAHGGMIGQGRRGMSSVWPWDMASSFVQNDWFQLRLGTSLCLASTDCLP